MNEIVLQPINGAYDVFIHSNEMATGTTKTGYIYLGRTGGIVSVGSVSALALVK